MLDIIWATGRDCRVDWEFSWIVELLRGIPLRIHPPDRLIPNALIVFNHNVNYLPYLQLYETNQVPFTLIHLSDEYKTDNISPYYFKMCKGVFRNCYRSDCTPPAIHFPLGYKYDFWKNGIPITALQRSIEQRSLVWSFAGGMRPNRKDTVALFQTLQPHRIVIEEGNSFNDVKTGLGTEEYRNLMLDSIFVLCPEGNVSVDCFRVYEALECGCIPIVFSKNRFQWFEEGSYWKHIMQLEEEPPFVMALTMEENLAMVKTLLENKEQLEEQRRKCWLGWQEYKEKFGKYLSNTCLKA